MKSLSDLRPCDNCRGPVGLMFHVIRVSMAIVNAHAVNEYLGMHRFFGGRAAPQLVENFAPSAANAVTVAGDEHPELMTEIVVCQDCLFMKDLSIPVLIEAVNARRKTNDAGAPAAIPDNRPTTHRAETLSAGGDGGGLVPGTTEERRHGDV